MNADDRTVDVIAVVLLLYVVLAFGSITTFLFLAAYDVIVQHREFHPEAFGTGLAATITGTGLAALFTLWKKGS